jgi:O-phosphoseryl-tRNA(Cys) synthetase
MVRRIVTFVSLVVLLVAPNAFARYDSYSYEYMNSEGILYFDIINRAVTLKGSLGLSDDQAEKLKELSLRMEKQHLKDLAEIRMAELELRETLKAYNVDGNKVMRQLNRLYDQKKKEKKNMIEGYVKCRSIMTKAQFMHLQDILQMEYMDKEESSIAGKREFKPRLSGQATAGAADEDSCSSLDDDESDDNGSCGGEKGFVGDGSGDYGDGSGTRCGLGAKSRKAEAK